MSDGFDWDGFADDVAAGQDALSDAQEGYAEATNRRYRRRWVTNPETGREYPIIEYMDPNEDGSEGDWIPDEGYDFEDIYGRIDDVYDEVGDFQPINETGYAVEDDINRIREIGEGLAAGPSDADLAYAEDYAGRAFGYTGDEFQDYLNQTWAEYNQGYAGQAGLSQEEIDRMEYMSDRNIAYMEEMLSRDLENIWGETGSLAQRLGASEHALRAMGDARAAANTEIFNRDQEQRRSNYEALKERVEFAVETGSINRAQALEGLRQDRIAAINALATSVTANIEAYSADAEALNAWVDSQYQMINAEMAMDQHTFDMNVQAFEQHMSPHIYELEGAVSTLEGLLASYNINSALDDEIEENNGKDPLFRWNNERWDWEVEDETARTTAMNVGGAVVSTAVGAGITTALGAGGLAVALASNPVGWAIGAGIALVGAGIWLFGGRADRRNR